MKPAGLTPFHAKAIHDEAESSDWLRSLHLSAGPRRDRALSAPAVIARNEMCIGLTIGADWHSAME
jgi:hypothetical protein